ncbi:MAG: murein biosynthesis integral membrane protein MurJ [Gammaproteobacteria bacterium]|nr:murein biosynthesis integral membrane protein MurJ [Gammaproteobacteria bacterium]
MSQRLLKSTATVGGMTLLSRVFGLARDVVIARLFGAGMGTDAFFVAFRIPNFFRRLFGEGAFAQAFIPVLSEYKQQRGEEEVRNLIDHTTATLGLIVLAVTVVGVVAAPIVILVFAPGFREDMSRYDLAVSLLRLTFPYLLFISLTALAGAILNAWRRFAVPAFTPVLLNLSLIGAAIWLAPYLETPIEALAWGVLIAGVVQLLFQLPFLLRLRLMPRPFGGRDREGVGRIFKLMLPTLFGVSVSQINVMIDTLIASFLVSGSISWLYYSDRMMEFPLGVFGIALATVILPQLSEKHAEGNGRDYSLTLDWGLRWVWLISVPAAVGLAVLAVPIMVTLFQYGSFTPVDAAMASRSLMAFAIGLPAFVLIKVLATAFFSRQDTRTPVKAGVAAMVTNIILNLALVGILAHAGLALATSIAAAVNAGLLFFWLKRYKAYTAQPGWHAFLLRVITATFVMAALLVYWLPGLDEWVAMGLWWRIGMLTLWVAAGLALYPIILLITGMRPWHLSGTAGTLLK